MKWAVGGLALLFFGPLLFMLPILGLLEQSWAPFWFGKQDGGGVAVTVPIDSNGHEGFTPAVPSIPLEPPVVTPPVTSGHVSDIQRYQLITAAGAPPPVAIILTAISIAEDGSGNPAAVSAPNVGLAAGTVDIGILQINSAHIGQCGIQSKEWLFDPMNNARAAMCILGPKLNYCAWSTYEASCGPGHNSAYRAFVTGATLIAQGQQWQH